MDASPQSSIEEPGTDDGRWWDLSGRTAVVTGAAGWLGTPMVEGLARAGASVWCIDQAEGPLRGLESSLSEHGFEIECRVADVTDAVSLESLVRDVSDRDGHVAVLVNNAHCGNPEPLDIGDDAAYSREAGQGPVAYWRIIRASLDLLKESVALHKDASVINISSMYGKVSPYPEVYQRTGESANPLFYGVAKAGVLQMTRWLAVNLGPEGIRVNSISPGPFPQRDLPSRNPEFVAELAARTPLGRVGRRHETAAAVVFLASRGASFVTGADLAVDGGWTAW